jgi:SOUL heme-binding protein
MKNTIFISISFIFILVVIAWLLWTVLSVKGIEEPVYTVLEAREGYEIREYAPYIVAQTQVKGTQDEALNTGFRVLAGYIFGGNTTQESISMTAPVNDIKQVSEKIQMTVPVIDIKWKDDVHIVQFTMPKRYTLKALPKPNDTRVQFVEIPKTKKAVLRYSGWATETRVTEKKDVLENYLKKDSLETIGDMISAQYNPPWSIPFMRRNEIMIGIK